MPLKKNKAARRQGEKLPLVAIFGRANVGKSTLFNRLSESNQALTSPIAGTTRDSNQAIVEWQGVGFNLVDTGGILNDRIFKLEPNKLAAANEPLKAIEDEIIARAIDYLARADLILFVVDVKSGLLEPDIELAKFIKKKQWAKKAILTANKVDSPKLIAAAAEFHQLNLGRPWPVSAVVGLGTGDLLDEITKKLKRKTSMPSIEIFANISIVGKPNVGKSSLLNALLGEKKVIVSPLPHTTREPQDTILSYEEKNIRLIDTAGLSKQGLKQARRQRVLKTLAAGGIRLSLKSLARADIALLVIDISQPLTVQDAKIAEEIIKQQKSLIIIANKWDLISKKDVKKFKEYISYKLPFVTWAPIYFVSALTKRGLKSILPAIVFAQNQRQQFIAKEDLDIFLKKIAKIRKPTKGKGFKRPFIHKIRQTRTGPPQFEVVIGAKDNLAESYIRFIANQLRAQFDFAGAPISIFVRRKRKKEKPVKNLNA